MPDILRALILEDRPSDLELLVHELRSAGFDPRYAHVTNETEYRARLADGWDVILADYSLPQFNALAALRIEHDMSIDVPFIVVTGSISEEAAVTCMREGAVDYLIKDRLARLGPAVRQALESKVSRDAKSRAEEQTRHRNRELTLLNHIIAASSESANETAFLQVACRELLEALEVTHASATVVNDEHTEGTVIAECTAPGGPSIIGSRFPLWSAGAGPEAARSTAPLVMEELARLPQLGPYSRIIEEAHVKAIMVIPLVVDGRPFGSLSLAVDREHHFTGDRMELARSVADQISGSLSKTRVERDRRLLNTAIERTTDGIVVVAPDGRIIYVNHGYEAASGYCRAEILGRSIVEASGVGFDADTLTRMNATLDGGGQWRDRAVCRRKDGRSYQADFTLSKVFANDGSLSCYVVVQRDITEQLEMQQRYLQSQKMEAVGRLAGGVAHDFNNIITALLAYGDLLAEQIPPGSEASESLEEIRKAGSRAASLTRQLLIFSRRQAALPQAVNLPTLVTELEKMLRRLIGEDITVTCAFAEPVCSIWADPGQVEQVIMNLAINARDAMPQGGTLTIATRTVRIDETLARGRPEARPGAYVELSVADTGVGMPDDVLAHAFEPFFTTKEEGKGTGLGLATVYGIVKQAGGWIEVQSSPGAGTTLRIFFPLYAEEGGAAASSPQAEGSPRGNESVLLVDDDATVRKLVARVLTRLGYSVTTFAMPEEALRWLAEGQARPDLLVTDIVMPGMSGPSLADKVRERVPGIAVLTISGYERKAVTVASTEAFRFLRKPFTQSELAKAVRQSLEGPQA